MAHFHHMEASSSLCSTGIVLIIMMITIMGIPLVWFVNLFIYFLIVVMIVKNPFTDRCIVFFRMLNYRKPCSLYYSVYLCRLHCRFLSFCVYCCVFLCLHRSVSCVTSFQMLLDWFLVFFFFWNIFFFFTLPSATFCLDVRTVRQQCFQIFLRLFRKVLCAVGTGLTTLTLCFFGRLIL